MKRTGIILLLLVVVLFSECKKKQARYLPYIGISQYDSIKHDTVFHTIAPFKLIDQLGQVVTQDTFKNKVYVANFFFVTCPGICKQMNGELERVAKTFAGNQQVKFISHTVTPDQDSVPVLLQYAKLHDAVPYQWYFLTGDKKQILDLAIHSYLAESDGYLVHSPNLTLIDMQGHIRGVYSGTVESDVNKLITDINLLLKEEKENGYSN